jgi:CRP-like cAMP-binding protein
MEEFFAYVQQFGSLDEQQVRLLAQEALRVTLRKGEYFFAPGTTDQGVGFVLAGVLRVCSCSDQGDEITRYFLEERHLILDGRHPAAAAPASHFVQAITDCQLVVFTAQQWRGFAQLIPGWETIVLNLKEQAMREKLKRVLPLVAQDAAARYTHFLTTYPYLANRVPLAYIASYLGMTQSSLSRIRKNIR